MRDLLSELPGVRASEPIGEGAVVLRGFASARAGELLHAVDRIREAAPFRHLTTPGGHVMSVAMTNCGNLGWVSDRRGYRYQRADPLSGEFWPAMPAVFAPPRPRRRRPRAMRDSSRMRA
jgi:alkylated DNA repair protein (DNA oxidative demethylase)